MKNKILPKLESRSNNLLIRALEKYPIDYFIFPLIKKKIAKLLRSPIKFLSNSLKILIIFVNSSNICS